MPGNTTVVASGARTTSGNQTFDAGLSQTLRVQVNTTAVSGTTPSMTVTVEDTLDGTNWNVVDTFTAVTAVNRQVRSVTVPFTNQCRIAWAITGTTPSFTFAVDVYQE